MTITFPFCNEHHDDNMRSAYLLLALTLVSTLQAAQGDVQFRLSAKITQCISAFSTYGHIRVNDEFILDSRHMPRDKWAFNRPGFDRDKDVEPYMVLDGELKVRRCEIFNWGDGGKALRINLSTDGDKSHLVMKIQMLSDSEKLLPGTKINLKLLEESGDDITGMAEAVGVVIE